MFFSCASEKRSRRPPSASQFITLSGNIALLALSLLKLAARHALYGVIYRAVSHARAIRRPPSSAPSLARRRERASEPVRRTGRTVLGPGAGDGRAARACGDRVIRRVPSGPADTGPDCRSDRRNGRRTGTGGHRDDGRYGRTPGRGPQDGRAPLRCRPADHGTVARARPRAGGRTQHALRAGLGLAGPARDRGTPGARERDGSRASGRPGGTAQAAPGSRHRLAERASRTWTRTGSRRPSARSAFRSSS